jgi:chromosome segregation ATPase
MAGTSSVYRIARSLLIGLTAVLAIGVIGSFYMGVRATNAARTLARDEAVAIVDNSLPFVFTTSDLATPASDTKADEIDMELARVIYDPTAFDDVAIYSPSGTIVYATDPSLIGQRPTEARDPVRAAARGVVTVDQSDGQFSVLAPLSLRTGGEMSAAVQLTRDDGPIAAAAGPWRFNAIFLAIALAVVGFLLWRIGRLSATAVATQAFAPSAGAARIAGMTPRAIEVNTPGLREEGDARRKAEERATAAEQRLQVLQDQYKVTLDELHNVQRALAERAAAPSGPDPETESRLLKSEGRVRLLEGQLAAMSAERDKLAKQMVEAATSPKGDPELERRSRMVQQEAIGLRAELEGAQTELSLTRRQLEAIKEEAARAQEVQQSFDAAQVEIQHANDAMQAARTDAEQARAELEDARAEMRALRTEEQRAAVLGEELRATKAELDSLKASHSAELVERETDFESMVRRTREEFQGELDAIQKDLKRQFAQREEELQQKLTEREAEFAAREAALTEQLAAREQDLTAQLAARESELTGEISTREAKLQRKLEEREAELRQALEERESDLGEELAKTRKEAKAAAAELEAAHRDLQSARDELAARERESGDGQEQLRKANEELVRSQTEIETLQRELTEAQRVATDAKTEVGAATAEIQAELRRGVELTERAETAERELRAERERAEESRTELERLQAEAELVRAEADRARQESAELTERLAASAAEHRDVLAAASAAHQQELAAATAAHQAEVAELTAQVAGRSDLDEVLRASQERLATQTERLVEVEERAHKAERELTQALARTEELETELRQVQLEKAMRDLRDQEAAEAAAAHVPAMSEEDVLEDRRASTPFTKELSLDAQKTISQIMGVTKIMKFKKEAKDQTQLIKQLTSQVRRLEHTVADLADVDALVHGSVQLSIRRSDLEALVTRVVEESAVSQDHDVRIEAQPVVAGVDPLRVEQMLAGMLRASGERTASGKLITVRLTNHEGGALLAVEDGEPSSDASMSPVVQRLAEVHGGWAKVEGREGGGSSFQVFLPDGARPDASPDAETPSSDTLQIVVNAPTGAAPESEPEPEPADTPWTQSEEALLVQELHRLSAED